MRGVDGQVAAAGCDRVDVIIDGSDAREGVVNILGSFGVLSADETGGITHEVEAKIFAPVLQVQLKISCSHPVCSIVEVVCKFCACA